MRCSVTYQMICYLRLVLLRKSFLPILTLPRCSVLCILGAGGTKVRRNQLLFPTTLNTSHFYISGNKCQQWVQSISQLLLKDSAGHCGFKTAPLPETYLWWGQCIISCTKLLIAGDEETRIPSEEDGSKSPVCKFCRTLSAEVSPTLFSVRITATAERCH